MENGKKLKQKFNKLVKQALKIQNKLKAEPIELIHNDIYQIEFINSKHYYIGL